MAAVGRGEDSARVVRRLWRFVRPHRRTFWAAACVLSPVNQACGLVQPLLVKLAVDGAIAQRDLARLDRVALAFAAAIVAEAATGYGQQYLTNVVAQRSLTDLRVAAFARLQRLPLRFFDGASVGQLVSRLTTDADVLTEVLAAGVVTLGLDLVRLVGIVGFMLWIDWRLAVTSLALLPAVGAIIHRARRAARYISRRVLQRLAAISGHVQEAVSGMTAIALAGREAASQRTLERLNGEHRDATAAGNRVEVALFSLVEAASAVSVAAVLWQGGRLGAHAAVQVGTIVAFVQYVQQLFVPIRELTGKYSVLQTAAGAAERLFALLDTAEEPVPDRPRVPARVRGEVVFDRVWFAYRDREWVLRDVSFRIAPGEQVAIVGATGSGKTTLVKLLEGFYPVQRGRILVDGIDVRAWEPRALRKRIAVVLQDVFLFSGTVASNVTLGRADVSRPAVERAIEALGAAGVVRRLGGWDASVGERGGGLSAGERQLVAFARALARDPAILVLDEATARLDRATERQVERALEALRAGRTSITIAHRLATIEAAERVLVMDGGRLREDGTPGALVAAGGLYAELRAAGGLGSPAERFRPAATG
jgi:ATP-binding cassette subfamily B multidrug efflux pump